MKKRTIIEIGYLREGALFLHLLDPFTLLSKLTTLANCSISGYHVYFVQVVNLIRPFLVIPLILLRR